MNMNINVQLFTQSLTWHSGAAWSLYFFTFYVWIQDPIYFNHQHSGEEKTDFSCLFEHFLQSYTIFLSWVQLFYVSIIVCYFIYYKYANGSSILTCCHGTTQHIQKQMVTLFVHGDALNFKATRHLGCPIDQTIAQKGPVNLVELRRKYHWHLFKFQH